MVSLPSASPRVLQGTQELTYITVPPPFQNCTKRSLFSCLVINFVAIRLISPGSQDMLAFNKHIVKMLLNIFLGFTINCCIAAFFWLANGEIFGGGEGGVPSSLSGSE